MTVSSRLAAFVAVSALASLHAACDVGDQLCPVGTNYNDKDDACPYGPPGGPKRDPVTCPPVAAVSPDECVDVTWTATVFPILDNKAVAGCTNNGCHGDVQNKVLLPSGKPDQVFAALAAYQNQVAGQVPYLNVADPTRSWMSCNLHDPAKGNSIGTPMPLGFPVLGDEDLATIDRWLGCGAPK